MLMILCFLPAVCTSSTWFYFRHEPWAWVLQDILSFSLCIQILSLVRAINRFQSDNYTTNNASLMLSSRGVFAFAGYRFELVAYGSQRAS
jgi:hypothetical protein